MNLSHTIEDEQSITEAIAQNSRTINSTTDTSQKTDKQLAQKILLLLDETTPNYVLGYN